MMHTCCYPPCNLEALEGRHFCGEHQKRWRRGGLKRTRGLTLEERFRRIGWTPRTVVPELGDCWEWNGSRNRWGYGQFHVGPATNAPRAAYIVEHGAIPEGLHVMHRCDNPPCVNPAHLIAGTRSENMLDMARKGRHPYTHRKISDAQVREIRARYTGAWGEQAALGREYGVSTNQINLIVRGLARRSA